MKDQLDTPLLDNEEKGFIQNNNQDTNKNHGNNNNSDNILFNSEKDDDSSSNRQLQSSDYMIRQGFITKVYGILSAQLLLTVIVCAMSMISKSFFEFQIHNAWLMYLCFIGTLVIVILPMCYENLFRTVPTNYILLFSFTFMESYIVSILCGMISPRLVLMAAFMTLTMTFALTLYAMTTKEDLTVMGGLLFSVLVALFLFGIFAMFTNNRLLHIILCCGWIIMYALYIIYDTQLIIGNKKHSISTDDYILAAFMLYIDIIGLFIELLSLLSDYN